MTSVSIRDRLKQPLMRSIFLTASWFLCVSLIYSGTNSSLLAQSSQHDEGAKRTARGLVVFYDFAEEDLGKISDKAGFQSPFDLTVSNPKAVKIGDGQLQILQPVEIVAAPGNRSLMQAVNRSGEITIEAWIRPDNTTQAGPARIVSFSKDSSNRNFTLGQDKNRYDVRLRTQKTDSNGLPSTSTPLKTVDTKPTHVTFTRGRSGRNSLYVNGKSVTNGTVNGSFGNWQPSYSLRLGDEGGGGRLWRGTYYLVAIFDRSLTSAEVEQHYRLGPNAKSEPREAPKPPDTFANQIAPLLSEHCLECHDAATRQGGLDLSHKVAAFNGGDSGRLLARGNAADSLLYQSVASNDMPHNRPPLTDEDKLMLQNWINAGAKWTVDFIDPALYQHDGGAEQLWIQRLTRPEYIATVKTTLGIDIQKEAERILPAELRADGFSNTAYNLNVDLKHIEAYSILAQQITDRMDIGAFVKRFSKRRKFTDKDMGEVVQSMGKWVLRGPLTEEEVILYRGISTTVASSGGNFEQAVKLILQAMLQSPRFLYRIENQQGDGYTTRVNQYELASRISYILWGSSPDKQLFQLAEEGKLYDTNVLQAQAARMLESPKATERAQQFIHEWLNLQSLENLQPNAERFPNWKPELALAMQSETTHFFTQIAVQENRPLHELLTAQTTFVSPELAKHYRLLGQSTPVSDELLQFDLAKDPNRGGILTQGSVLTIGGDDASMVTRGLFVLHDLLRGVVKDPPPCVDTTPVPTEPGLTQRMIATRRIQNESCGGCHAKFEPLAFGLGKFDGLGTYLDQDEHGNQLQDDGNVLIPGERDPRSYNSSSELMEMLASSPRVRESITWKVVQFAMGRPLTASDAPIVQQIHTLSQKQGGTYRSLMKALVMSELVQQTPTETYFE